MDTCRWTDSNGAPWVFCDRPGRAGSSWCAEHHARVFQAGSAPSNPDGSRWYIMTTGTRPSQRRFNKHTDAKWGQT